MVFKKGYTPWNKGMRGEGTAFYGRRHTDETKKKISEAKKGKRCSPETEFKKGHKQSKEIRDKITEYNRNNRNSGMFKAGEKSGYSFPVGHEPWNKNLKKQTNTGKTHFKKGMIPWNKGLSLDYMRGEKNWNWGGGVSDKGYPEEWTPKLRESVRCRDSHTCQKRGISQDEHKSKLSVHHVDFDKTNSSLTNLITYCIKCHISLHAANVADSRGQGSLQKIQLEE